MTTKSLGERPTRIQIYLNHPWNVIQTGFMLLTWIVLGMHNEVIAPTMPTLAANVNVHYSGMGSVLASRGVGYLTANILGAMLRKIVKNHSNAIVACGYILPAIAMFVTPFVTSVLLLSALFFMQGIGHGLGDLGGTNLLLTMWGDQAATPLNVVRLGYGVGAVCANLLARPFLTAENSSRNSTETKPNIIIPYTITSALCSFIAVGHIYFYIHALKARKEKPNQSHSSDTEDQIDFAATADANPGDVNHLGENRRDSIQYERVLSVLFIGSVFFIFGNEQTFAKFYFTYLKFDQFHISNSAANWGIILFWLSYSIGRFIIAVVSIFISVTTCLNIIWFETICLVIAWLVFVWVIGLTATSLFILGGITGLVFGPIIPSTLAFFNQRLNVGPFLLALVLCGTALGLIIFPKLGGLIMDRNPNHFPTLLFFCTSMSVLLYAISNGIHFLHRRRSVQNSGAPVINDPMLNSKSVNEEEQQIVNYLKEQEKS